MKHKLSFAITLSTVAIAWMFILDVASANRAATVQAEATAQSSGVDLPPECTTRTRLDSPIQRAWVFVMNFRVGKTGCVRVYDRSVPEKLVGYRSLPNACEAQGDVQFVGGKGIFNGGYVSCTVNIMDAVNAISGTTPITEVAENEGFYLIGRGVLSPTAPTGTQSSIVSYQPADETKPSVSLGIIVTDTNPNHAYIVTTFNGVFHDNPNCAFGFDGAPEQIWGFTRNGGRYKTWLGSNELCFAGPLPRLELWQNGGTFYIGGHPKNFPFYGILDEVVIDPPDGGSPPGALGDNLEEATAFVFLPLTLR